MPTPSLRQGKQHYLEVAEALFTEHGYQTVSIRDIAHASGVTKAALYYHFPSKEALFDQVIENHVNKLAEKLRKARARADTPREQLVFMLTEFASQISLHRSRLFSLPQKPNKVSQDQVKTKHALLIDIILSPLDEVLKIATEQGELRPLPDNYSPAALLLGLFHGMAQHRKHATNCPLTGSDIKLIVDIFWEGLKR